MHTICPKCQSDFEVVEDLIQQDRIFGRCPFCDTKYTFLSEEFAHGGPRVVFDEERVQKRVCIQCSREFESIEQDAVPICPLCKGETKKETKPLRRKWQVIRSGRSIDYESEAEIKEAIAHGEIRATDILVSPDQTQRAAKEHAPFEALFRSQLAKKDKTRNSTILISRRYRSANFLFKISIYFVVLTCLSWFAYRFFTYHEDINESEQILQMLAQNYALEVPPPTEDFTSLLEKAYKEISLDRQEGYRDALTTLKQVLITQPKLPETLGRIAEVNAFVSGSGSDHKTKLKALELAELAIRLFPKQPQGYLAKVRAALSAENFEGAGQALERAKAYAPDHPRVRLAEGAFLLASNQNREQLEQAIQILSTLLQVTPPLLEVYDLIGQAHILLHEPAQAASAFEQRLSLSPDDPKALYRMGQLAERSGNLSAAKEWFQRALRESASIVGARLHLGLIYHRIDDDPQLAEKHFQYILKRYRSYASLEQIFDAQQELARIYAKQNETKKLTQLLKDLPLLLSEDPRFVQIKAFILLHLNQTQNSIRLLTDRLTQHSGEIEIEETLGLALAKEQNWEPAIKAFRAAIKIDPKNLSAYLNLISMLVQNQRFDEALDVANAAFSRAGTDASEMFYQPFSETSPPPVWTTLLPQFQILIENRPLASVSHGIMGLCLMRKGISQENDGDLQRAITFLRKARDLDKGSELAHFFIGRAHFAQKNWNLARIAFQSAQNVNPISPLSRFWLGQTLYKMGRFDSAEKIFKTLEKDPSFAFRAKTIMGLIAHREDKKEMAQAYWKEALSLEPLYKPAWKAILENRS